MTELEEFGKQKDVFLATDRHSPLTAGQRKDSKGLEYFPENPDLRLEVDVEELPEKHTVEMQTSTGSVQSYIRYGTFKFNVDGQQAEFTLFSDRHGFFPPFADALAGKATYGAGRYLEPKQLPNGRLLVDFNYAYNPYCAYNELFSCPLTPIENRLKVPIRAGEKLPAGDWLLRMRCAPRARWELTAGIRRTFEKSHRQCQECTQMLQTTIVKQVACAAAISRSGFVSSSSPNRDPYE